MSFANQSQADSHGGVALAANRLHLVFHGDVFAGVDDLDVQPRGGRMTIQLCLDSGFRTHEQHTHAVVARRVYGALDFWLGRAVGTHRIQRDYARHV